MTMRRVIRSLICLLLTCLATSGVSSAQQVPADFHWVDFHDTKEEAVVTWVTRTLAPEKWTAIREIGVSYDAALVITSKRSADLALPDRESFTIWNVSLTNHSLQPLVSGVNLRWLDWLLLAEGHPRELTAFYDSCRDCQADTYFTAFTYDVPTHAWRARWQRGSETAPVWTEHQSDGVILTQVYAIMSEPTGRQIFATWNHLEFPVAKDVATKSKSTKERSKSGKEADEPAKEPQDYIYRYDLDPFTSLDRSMLMANKDAESMKLRLCSAQPAQPLFARGQDSALCHDTLPHKNERTPNTRPPANNHGRMGAR